MSIADLTFKEKVSLLKELYLDIASKGQDGDTMLAHINPREAILLKAHGGSGTINPTTGLPEYKSCSGSLLWWWCFNGWFWRRSRCCRRRS